MEREFVGNTTVLVGEKEVEVMVIRNEKGNLEIRGIGSVSCYMLYVR